jgi:hypothetical protein
MTFKIDLNTPPKHPIIEKPKGLPFLLKAIFLSAMIPLSKANQTVVFNENMKKQVFLTCLNEIGTLYPHGEEINYLSCGQKKILHLAECIDAIPVSEYPQDYAPTRSLSQERIHSIFESVQNYLSQRQPSIQAWISHLISALKTQSFVK